MEGRSSPPPGTDGKLVWQVTIDVPFDPNAKSAIGNKPDQNPPVIAPSGAARCYGPVRMPSRSAAPTMAPASSGSSSRACTSLSAAWRIAATYTSFVG